MRGAASSERKTRLAVPRSKAALNTKQGVFLSLESGDDEAVIGTRPSRRVGQFLVKRENRTNVE